MHYIGILFSGDKDLLENYYEGLEVEPYIEYSKDEIIQIYINSRKNSIKWHKDKIKKNDPKSSEFQKWLNEHPKYTKKTAWNAIKEDYEDSIDKNGNIISKCNPNGKWDWYMVGGRWTGYFPLKEKDSEGNPKYCNESTIDEIDWDLYKELHHSPYCYITEDGDWVAKGDIGWFCSRNDMDRSDWQDSFFDELKKYSGDTYVTAIDFHI